MSAYRNIRILRGECRVSPEDLPRGGCCDTRSARERMFISNAIKSTKYTYANFLPVNLWEQLVPWRKPANFYFLVIAIMQTISEISTTQGKPTLLMPLLFVIIVTMFKDWAEDSKRREQDREANEAMYKVWRGGRWVQMQSQSIMVGDFVYVPENAKMPADVLVTGSGSDNGDICFVDTKDLDGETNLKPKATPGFLLKRFPKTVSNPDNVANFSLVMQCDSPEDDSFTDMEEWKGMVATSAEGKQAGQGREYVNMDNFVLRTCVVRSTPWIVGLVVYTGEDTKIRKNNAKDAGSIRYKTSQLFGYMNTAFVVMGALQLSCCVVAALGAAYWQDKLRGDGSSTGVDGWGDAWYLALEKSAVVAGVLRFFTWFIICKDFLPISLYVSLEMVQFLQARFMDWDQNLWARDAEGNWSPPAVQTSRLNEELAQIHYVFSDKTGTLTQNRMDFKKCVIGARQYGTLSTTAGVVRQARLKGLNVTDELRRFNDTSTNAKVHDFVEFDEQKRVFADLAGWPGARAGGADQKSGSAGTEQSRMIADYFYALSLNNSVFPKLKESAAKKTIDGIEEKIIYDMKNPAENVPLQLNSSSPDEKALVYFAQFMGWEIYQRSEGLVRLKRTGIDGKRWFEDFEDVCLIDFSSKRKRMTVIVSPKFGPDRGKLKIYCKGADSYVKALLRGAKKGPSEIDRLQKNCAYTFRQLEEFGGESLRTLIVSTATKPREWWFGDGKSNGGWKAKYDAAVIKGDKAELAELETEIERDAEMDLIGATAIEDKLQEGVPEAIRAILNAKIKLWVLTGDNVATAINIGISCNLLEADMTNEGRLFIFDDFEKAQKDLTEDEMKSSEFKAHVARLAREAGVDAPRMSVSRVIGDGELASPADESSLDIQQQAIIDAAKREFVMRKKTAFLSGQLERAIERIPRLREKFPGQPLGMALHGNVWKVVANAIEEAAENPSAKVGDSLSVVSLFYQLGKECKSVLGCRLEPNEKAEIVKLIQTKEGVPTLAIGDGNNDTVMIKTAEVGVGIRGVEGTSAVSASDYVIGQFRFLARLLLVYGRLNNRRISMLIYYIFYKSSLVVWTVLYFGFFSAFSGQFPYLDWMYQIHNILFTGLPIVVFAVLDADIEMDVLQINPFVYPWTRGPVLYGARVLTSWLLLAFLHGTICFFVPWYIFEVTSPEESGQTFGFPSTMLVTYVCVVLVTNLKLVTQVKSWNPIMLISIWGSIILLFFCIMVLSSSTIFSIGGIDYYYVGYRLFTMPRFWCTIIITVGFVYILDLATATLGRFCPSRTRIFVEAANAGKPLFDPDNVEDFDGNDKQGFVEHIRRNTHAEDGKSPAARPHHERKYTGSNFEHTPNQARFFTSQRNLNIAT